jgi:predicted RNase H-like HicB family nuclease
VAVSCAKLGVLANVQRVDVRRDYLLRGRGILAKLRRAACSQTRTGSGGSTVNWRKLGRGKEGCWLKCHTLLSLWLRDRIAALQFLGGRLRDHVACTSTSRRYGSQYHGPMLRFHVAFYLPRATGEMVVAEALDFPGAASQGFDLPDARLMIASALEDLAQLLVEEGKPLPTPNPNATAPDADLVELGQLYI